MENYFDFLKFRDKRIKRYGKKPKDKDCLVGLKGVAYSPVYYFKDKDGFIRDAFTKRIIDTAKG